MTINLYGQESTKVSYTETIREGENNTRTERRYDYATSKFFDIDNSLVSHPGNVAKDNMNTPLKSSYLQDFLPSMDRESVTIIG